MLLSKRDKIVQRQHRYDKGGTKMMPEIGMRVIYRTDGICKIEDVREEDFSSDGSSRRYYVLKPESNPGATFYVPVDNPRLTEQMQPLLSESEAKSMLALLDVDSPCEDQAWITDSRARGEHFRSIMAAGDRVSWIRVVRTIAARRKYLYATGKKLPGADDAVLRKLLKALTEEFSAVLHADQNDIAMVLSGETAYRVV